MNYLLALDQGTSSTRAMIYNEKGELIVCSQYTLTQHYPRSGWVEHDPEEIWQKTLQAMSDVIKEVNAKSVLCCGITNQRETTVIWDKTTGICLAPAIVWQDRRTEEYCRSLSAHFSMIKDKTGLLCEPYFSASKLNWLLTNHKEARELAKKGHLAFGTIDSFLIWRLTKGKSHYTDVSNASRTMLYNIVEGQWDDDLLALFSIPYSVLPEVLSSDGQFGVIHHDWLGIELPITGVAGDQQAALIGQRCFEKGMVKATFGTGGFLLLNSGSIPCQSNHHLLTTIAYRIHGATSYGLEGSIYHAGTTIKWLHDEMNLITSPAETENLASSLHSNEGVYLVSSFTGLGAPHWLATSGARIFGLSRSSNRAHFARAALEGVCYQTREILTCMREDSHLDLTILSVDGGMAANSWFLQFLADQCQLTVRKPKDIETTAKGAALLAGLGLGLYDSFEDLQQVADVEKEFRPMRPLIEVESDYHGWYSIMQQMKNSGI